MKRYILSLLLAAALLFSAGPAVADINDFQVNNLTVHGNLYTSYDQTLTVAKAGGDYTSIQSAIDSIEDNSASKRYVILVFPGTYTEDITMEDYVDVSGIDGRTSVVIAGTVTFPADADNYSGLENVTVDLTTTSDAVDLVTVSNGVIRLNNVRLLLTNTQNDHIGSLIASTGGTLRVKNCYMSLDYDGSQAGANDFFVVDINGTTNFDFTENEVHIDVADEDDTVVFFSQTAASSGTSFFEANEVHMTLSSGSYSGICGAFYIHGSSPSQVIGNNHVHLATSGSGTGYAMYMDTTAGSGELHSNGNQLWVEDFTNNYSFNVASGDTVFSHFDDIRAASGTNGSGTFTYVNSDADGKLQASGDILGASVSAKFSGMTSDLTLFAGMVTLADDGTLAIPAMTSGGFGWVQSEDEYLQVSIQSSGAVAAVSSTANVAIADTDGNLCVYDDGANAKIKNRLGSSKNVIVNIWYH